MDNLLYQLKIKLVAEKAGLSSVSAENKQIALRFRGGKTPADLPGMGAEVRVGKTALWFPYSAKENWQEQLVAILLRMQVEREVRDRG